jgi:hypothetical protein
VYIFALEDGVVLVAADGEFSHLRFSPVASADAPFTLDLSGLKKSQISLPLSHRILTFPSAFSFSTEPKVITSVGCVFFFFE